MSLWSPLHLNKKNQWRIRAFYCALILVFLRFSLLQEVITHQLGFNFYPLYLFGVPASAGVLVTGGLRRAFRFTPTRYWTCFGLWLIPTTVVSIWRGGSLELLTTYYRTDLIMLFLIAGIVKSWEECRLLFWAIAGSAIATLGLLLAFGQRDENGRMTLKFGAISNSNDYAAHLLLLLPFLLWAIMSSKSIYLRMAGSLVLGFGIYQVFASASRGALLGMSAAVIVYLISAPSRQKKAAFVAIPIIVAITFSILPTNAVHRIFSFSENNPSGSAEALESSRIRQRLLKDSILYTLYHPLFGVGPGQFSTIEGTKKMQGQNVGLWFQTHNAYTETSSETGIPGLVFMLGGILSSLYLLKRITRSCRGKPECAELKNAVLCLRISIISFCTAIFFLNFAYTFYLPAIAGVTVAMALAVRHLQSSKNTKLTEVPRSELSPSLS